MGAPPTFVANQVLTASDVNTYLAGPIFAVKSADESVTSSTTLQNDDSLVVSVAASTNYLVTAFLLANGDTAGDISLTFTYPASALMNYGFVGASTSNTSNVSVTESNLSGRAEQVSSPTKLDFGVTTSSSNPAVILIHGYLAVAGTAGSLQLQWAQQTSSVTATKVFKSSWLRVERAY